MFLEEDAGPNVAIIFVCEFIYFIISCVNQLTLKDTHPVVPMCLNSISGDSKIAHETAMQRPDKMGGFGDAISGWSANGHGCVTFTPPQSIKGSSVLNVNRALHSPPHTGQITDVGRVHSGGMMVMRFGMIG